MKKMDSLVSASSYGFVSSANQEHPTLQKVKEFLEIGDGWHFGEGRPPTKEVAEIAKSFAEKAIMAVFDTDAFPGIDGEIMVTLYHKNHYLEFTIDVNEEITYVHEIDDTELEYIEGLSVQEAENKLNDFCESVWNSSGWSTKSTMIPEKRGSIAWPLKIHLEGVFLSFLKNASTAPAGLSVAT